MSCHVHLPRPEIHSARCRVAKQPRHEPSVHQNEFYKNHSDGWPTSKLARVSRPCLFLTKRVIHFQFQLQMASQRSGKAIRALPPSLITLPKARSRHRSFPTSKGGTSVALFLLALQWLSCQAPGVTGLALGLVGPVSVYCDWVRWKVGSATSISVWKHVKLSEQIRPRDKLACCWTVKQPTNDKQTNKRSFSSAVRLCQCPASLSPNASLV